MEEKRGKNKKVLTIGFLIVCIILIASYLSHLFRKPNVERQNKVSESPIVVKESIFDSGAVEVEGERDHNNHIEIDPGDFSQHRMEVFNAYHSLIGEQLEGYEEVRFSGYVVDANRDDYSVYKISDSQSLDKNSNYIEVGCWTYEDRHPEKGYAIGDYITVQGSVDYDFTQAKIIIHCSFIEKEGRRVGDLDYDKNKPYIHTTISKIKDDFSAGITALEKMLPRKRLIKSSGYYLEGPSADFGTAVRLSKDKVENWDHQGVSDGYNCIGLDYSWIEGIKNGDYVTWWVYFGNNWHHDGNNCVVAKIQKTSPSN